ncbi:MAG TPA: Hsp20/alpha crystallin family protein [Chitinophagaceae bacterium]|nr:Hsp20/alpha crystallin family protein [Chitinophagaceae bacterium]
MTQSKFNNRNFDRSFDNMVDELFHGLPVVLNDGYNFLTKQGYVPVNIKESANGYILEVVAPGFDKTDFKVNIENNVLTISAEMKSEETKEGNAASEKQIRKEYSYRSFKRSFTIDDKIDATAVEASYVNGVLKLNLPKKAEVREAAKDIKIN